MYIQFTFFNTFLNLYVFTVAKCDVKFIVYAKCHATTVVFIFNAKYNLAIFVIYH